VKNRKLAEETGQSWSINYRAFIRETGDDVRNLNFSWENRPHSDVRDNLNALFVAIGLPLKVVDVGTQTHVGAVEAPSDIR
jgi:hypothetical protein